MSGNLLKASTHVTKPGFEPRAVQSQNPCSLTLPQLRSPGNHKQKVLGPRANTGRAGAGILGILVAGT